LSVNPATKLVTTIKFYQIKDGEYQYQSKVELDGYNQPIDAKVFTLDEVPADVIRIDQTTQEVGLEKGNLTDEEAATEVVRQFFEALIAKDYARAGQLLEGAPADLIQKQFGQIKNILTRALESTFGIFSPQDSIAEHVRRDVASYRRILSLMDEIDNAYDLPTTNEEVDILDQFTERFFRLIDIDLYSLRARDKNRVQIYDVSLARQKKYRVVYVAGLLEKKFPILMKQDPIFSDWERCLSRSGCHRNYASYYQA